MQKGYAYRITHVHYVLLMRVICLNSSLADRRLLSLIVTTVALMLQCCVCLLSVTYVIYTVGYKKRAPKLLPITLAVID